MLKSLIPLLVALALFLLVVFVPRGPTAAGADTQEALAERAFLALQAGDFDVFAPAVISGADIEWMNEFAKGGPEAGRRFIERRGGADVLAAEARQRVETSFAQARRQGERELDWSQARFGGLDPEHTTTTQVGGVEAAALEFIVESGEKRVPVRLEQVVRGSAAWVLVGGFQYRPIHEGTTEYEALRMLQRVSRAVLMHRALHKELPADLKALREIEEHVGEPLLPEDPRDPWGRPIRYEVGADGSFFVETYGADGAPGTDDDIRHAPPSR